MLYELYLLETKHTRVLDVSLRLILKTVNILQCVSHIGAASFNITVVSVSPEMRFLFLLFLYFWFLAKTLSLSTLLGQI